MSTKKLLGLFLSWLLLAACRPDSAAILGEQAIPATPSPPARPALNVGPTATLIPALVTAKPPTPTLNPTESPTSPLTDHPLPWSEFPPPTITLTTAVPPPLAPFSLPEEAEVLVLLGTDSDVPGGGRTDTIMLLLFNRKTGFASLVSIPRDLYVYIPGWGMDRINTAYFRGGFDMLAQTLEYNLGVRPAHWALVRLSDFIHFIDDLDGVRVNVVTPLPDDCGGIPTGVVHMDGGTLLCYLRERHSSSDVERNRKQQEILPVILERVISLDGLSQLPEWYERYSGAIQTNYTLEDLLGLVPLVLNARASRLHNFQIGWNEVESWGVPDTGARVFLPKRDAILTLMQQAVDVLYPPVPATATPETQMAGTQPALPVTPTQALSETQP